MVITIVGCGVFILTFFVGYYCGLRHGTHEWKKVESYEKELDNDGT